MKVEIKMKAKNNLFKLVFSALMAAFVCVATLVIRIPSPLGGYINLGDCIVLVSGWLLGPVYGFLAGGIGSAIADLIGYPAYAVATFFIKGLQALVAYFVLRLIKKTSVSKAAYLISGVAAQLVMVGGYYVFEGFYYNSFVSVLANIPFNLIQSAVGILVGLIVNKAISKTRIAKKFGFDK